MLHDHQNVIVCLDDLVQLDDVGMIEKLHDLDLPFHEFACVVVEFVFPDDLHGHLQRKLASIRAHKEETRSKKEGRKKGRKQEEGE